MSILRSFSLNEALGKPGRLAAAMCLVVASPRRLRSLLLQVCVIALMIALLPALSFVTLTGALSPSSPTVGVTSATVTGTATPGATVTDTTDVWPDGTTHGPYTTTADSSGHYSYQPTFVLQQLGTYTETIHDSISGQTITVPYSGSGDFSASVNVTSRTVTAGQSASYTVTFTSISGFTGTVTPAALNWSPQIPGATGSWTPTPVTLPSNGTATSTFTLQTATSTTPGTYNNILLEGKNGSYQRGTPTVSLTVNSPTVTLTGALSPSSPTVGVTSATVTGTATPGATVTDTTDVWPDGTTHGPYTTTADSSGHYSYQPTFVLQQLGTYTETLHDSISGQTITVPYSGSGDFSASVNVTSRTVTAGQSASYTVTFTSISGFTGTVTPAALNWSPQIPGATGSWTPTPVTLPSNGTATSTFTLQTATSTTPGTYNNILLEGKNGSYQRGTPTVSLTVNSPTVTLTGALSPSSPTVGVTSATVTGTATPGATVTDTTDVWPDGTTHGPYTTTADSSGHYSYQPTFVLQQLGTYTETLHDSISGQTITVPYSGSGDFSASVNVTSRTVTAGQSASYTVTFTSISGFTGTVTPAALNWPQIPGATGSWTPTPVTLPSNGTATSTFTLQTATSTTPGTYNNILLEGKNGSYQRGTPTVSLTVNSPTVTLTGALSPSSPTVGVTSATVTGTATPGATVTDTTDVWPDGTTHGPYTTTADSSGHYSYQPTFVLQQLGTYTETLHDSISGQTITVPYSGSGDFSASVNVTSRTVTAGQSASYTVTFTSISAFTGTVTPAALNWSPQIPGATGSWSPTSVTLPSNGTATSTFTLQTATSTAPGSYNNILLEGKNGSYQRGTSTVSLTVNGGATGTPSGTLAASPNPCQVAINNPTCTISLTWTTQNVSAAQIWYTATIGPETPVTSGLNGTWPVAVQALPQQYVFHLWDYSSGSRGAELRTVSVSATGPGTAGSSPAVRLNPVIDAPGKTFTIYGSGLAAGSAKVYVQAPGASSGTVVYQPTIGSDGGFTFAYASSSGGPSGLYTVWAIDSTSKQSPPATFTVSQPTASVLPTCQSGNTPSACSQDPINTATGNYTYQHTDLTVAGRGLPFVFARTYNSQSRVPGPMGIGWTHSYASSITPNSDGSLTVVAPDGQLFVFDSSAGAYVSRFNYAYSTLQSPSSGTFILTTKALISYRFVSGQLTTISDRNGNTIQLAYSGSNLAAITDTVGRRWVFSADSSGRITSITDPMGRVLQYGYDGSGNLASFTDARGGVFRYAYDGANEMLTAVDPVNNTFLTNSYDSSGRVISQADGAGNRWTYSYDSGTLITTITDPNGRVTSHQHDSKFELLVATDTFGKTDQYQYDSSGIRISVQDRNGHTTQFNYDTNGNVISTVDAQSNVQAAAYDAQSNLLSRTDALGNQATFGYDSKGNLISSTDPLGNRTTFAYDSFGQLTSKTDPLGRTTQYSYDTSGNLIQTIDPLGNRTSYAYDALGRRTSTTAANGFSTTTAYDANDNILSATDALGNRTQYSYDGNNNRTHVTDPRGKATSYSYDANNKLLTTTDALGGAVTNAYDKLRNLASVTDQRNNTTRYTYDSENRMTRTTDPLQKTTSYGYDAVGNRTSVTDPLGNATAYGYDSLNRQVSTQDALGSQTSSTYDSAERVVKKTDAAGNPTTYAYDANGRQTSVQDAAGGVVSFQYDQVGNRTLITDTRGKATQFAYDTVNRLVTTTDPLTNQAKNQYDAVGNLVQVTDGNGNTKSYQYDGDRRQTKVTYSTGGSIQFTFDVNGNRTQMVDLIGTSAYVYDDLNRLQSYTSPFQTSLGFTYDASSNRTAIQYPGSGTVQYTYDVDGHINSVRDWNGFTATYTYDAAGRLTNVGYSNGLTSQYTYDVVGQNTRIQHNNGGTILYSEATVWSPNGNPTSSDISGISPPGLQPENTAYTYNDASELTSTSYGATASDKNGNVTTQLVLGQPTTFTYDLNNRATGITANEIGMAISYFGDGKIAQISQIDVGGSPPYLIDPTASGNRILGQLNPSGVGLQAAYVYGPRGMISQVVNGQTYTYFHNLQGSTVALVDATGVVRNSYRYDPFGQKLSMSSEQVTNSFAFLGSFSVLGIGQYSLMTHRLYDSRTGRFSGFDPARFNAVSSLSPFIYAEESPAKLIDPSGLWSLTNPLSFLDPAVNGISEGLRDVNDVIVNHPVEVANAYVCGFTFTYYKTACRNAGLTDTEIDTVGAVQNVAASVLTLGGSDAVALANGYKGVQAIGLGISLAPDVLKMAQGKLSTADALKLVGELSIELASRGTDAFIDEYSNSIGPSAAQKLAVVVANEAGFVGLKTALRPPGTGSPSTLTGGVSINGPGVHK